MMIIIIIVIMFSSSSIYIYIHMHIHIYIYREREIWYALVLVMFPSLSSRSCYIEWHCVMPVSVKEHSFCASLRTAVRQLKLLCPLILVLWKPVLPNISGGVASCRRPVWQHSLILKTCLNSAAVTHQLDTCCKSLYINYLFVSGETVYSMAHGMHWLDVLGNDSKHRR